MRSDYKQLHYMVLHLMHLNVFKVKNAHTKGRVPSASLGTEAAPSRS